MKIPFNKPFLTGKEITYIKEAVALGKISGDGLFTKRCHNFFDTRYGFNKCLLTTSCTDALEMIAILLEIKDGDEVIMPSFTFVSTANPFVLRGAKIIFCDSLPDHPNIDPLKVESLVTEKTKAIVVVHYAGVACDIDPILQIAEKHNVHLVEDAAQAIDSYYNDKPLGSFGCLSALSFHETKNVNCGEGGLLVVNKDAYWERAEVIREKGTNRSAFFRGEVDKYNWVDVGSSFLPSELNSAYLLAQLESIETTQSRRKLIWQLYFDRLSHLQDKGIIKLPIVPAFSTNNWHIFYIICRSPEERALLIKHLRVAGVSAIFHYQSLHKSPFFMRMDPKIILPNSEFFSEQLLRLPLYNDLDANGVEFVISEIERFYSQ